MYRPHRAGPTVWIQSGENLITLADLEYTYELAFLRIFLAWETLFGRGPNKVDLWIFTPQRTRATHTGDELSQDDRGRGSCHLGSQELRAMA